MIVVGAAGVLLSFFPKKALQILSAVLMAASLFAAPLAWSTTPVIGTLNSTIPNAGPDAATDMMFGDGRNVDTTLIQFLEENYGSERWAAAVPNANMAAPIILETGLPVMAVGGFSGTDSILTLEKLKEYIDAGDLRYYVSGREQNIEIDQWVKQNYKAVSYFMDMVIYDLKQPN